MFFTTVQKYLPRKHIFFVTKIKPNFVVLDNSIRWNLSSYQLISRHHWKLYLTHFVHVSTIWFSWLTFDTNNLCYQTSTGPGGQTTITIAYSILPKLDVLPLLSILLNHQVFLYNSLDILQCNSYQLSLKLGFVLV